MHGFTPSALKEVRMLVLVAALLLLGVVLGAVAHVPVAASLLAGAAIGVWLLVFAVRERRRPHRTAHR
ncbi:hypothetical protein [Streptomyces sp. SPB074]|uniref:hypothetical protein n=1 Tax=Streptomyces sp. (strain SPB074) TaxID=465543 RepID=UPI00131A122D|nr:hypothetical protein [Streptomyces sp. SPB074]